MVRAFHNALYAFVAKLIVVSHTTEVKRREYHWYDCHQFLPSTESSSVACYDLPKIHPIVASVGSIALHLGL
jgi:hypothetical protein